MDGPDDMPAGVCVPHWWAPDEPGARPEALYIWTDHDGEETPVCADCCAGFRRIWHTTDPAERDGPYRIRSISR